MQIIDIYILFHPGKRVIQINDEKPQINMTFMPMMSVCKRLTTFVYGGKH